MKIVLSYGLGVDSTALLLRWLNEPDSRDFDLSELLIVTAMTGDEWPETAQLVERHVLPWIAEAGVTFAQVARCGPSQKQGITILDESEQPRRLHVDGAYALSDELTAAGTIPQVGGSRYCSQKFKGWVIDKYLAETAPELTRHAFGYESSETARAARCEGHMPRRLAFGFEAGEAGRARRATEYDTPLRVAEFPLIEWGWDRSECLSYIEQSTGVSAWPKSACVYCPFALTNRAGRERTLDRYGADPESAMATLMLERRSLALNPRGGLIAGDRLFDLLWSKRTPLAKRFERLVQETPHCIYEVRRIWRTKRQVNRDLRVLHDGTRVECEVRLRRYGEVDTADGIGRVYLQRKGKELPAREHFLVAGPAGAKDKALPSFERWWEEFDHPQLTLEPDPLAVAPSDSPPRSGRSTSALIA